MISRYDWHSRLQSRESRLPQVSRLKHTPRKRFGQNFLHDAGIIRRIITAIAPTAGDRIVEIGPGRGAITRPLAAMTEQLDVIEIDRDLAAALAEQSWAANVRIHCADALDFDFHSLGLPPRSLRLVGNLPYNISTPLLFHILSQQDQLRDAHVMLQKEVVDRMTAAPGSRTYGRLTVALAARCRVESLFVIKPGAFTPAPQVLSTFTRLVPLESPLITVGEAPVFDELLRRAFGQRRKQLANSLQGMLSSETLRSAGIDPSLRAENLAVTDFAALTRIVHSDAAAIG